MPATAVGDEADTWSPAPSCTCHWRTASPAATKSWWPQPMGKERVNW